MTLVRVETAEENQALGAAAVDAMWLGGSDAAREGDWRWLDATRFWQGDLWGAPVPNTFAAWNDIEPNDLFGEDCVEIDSYTRKWNDADCDHHRGYICEGDFDVPRPLPQPDLNCSSSTYLGRKYTVCRDQRSWPEARARCLATGMDLVSIENSSENDFVRGFAGRDAHIGLSDGAEEGVWRWTAQNETTWCGPANGYGVPQGYTRWSSGHPKDTSFCAQESLNGKVYWFCGGSPDWQGARAACQSAGMDLAKIETQSEQTLLTQRMNANLMWLGAWVGGSDLHTEGSWRWGDGSLFWTGAANGAAPPGGFAKWYPGYPDDFLGADCLTLNPDGTWSDAVCYLPGDFICEGTARSTAFVQTPDTNDCARINVSGGTWTSTQCSETAAYVCEQVDPGQPAPDQDFRELAVNVLQDFSKGRPRVLAAEFPAGTVVKNPFLRYESAFGLRPCLDFLAPGTPQSGGAGSETLSYTQTFKGVPLEGYGYRVTRDVATKAVRSLLGSVDPTATSSTTPQVPVTQAAQRAAQLLGISTTAVQARRPGQLRFFPKPAVATRAWELAWWFEAQVNTTPVPSLHWVAVSAANLAVLHHVSDVFSDCASVPIPSQGLLAEVPIYDPPPGPLLSYDTSIPGDPHLTQLSQRAPSGTSNYALFVPSYRPSAASVGTVQLATRCPGAASNTTAAISATAALPYTVNPAEHDDLLAGLMRTAQFCSRFLAESMDNRDDLPWIVPNGTGSSNILLLLDPNSNNAIWTHGQRTLSIDPSHPRYRRAAPDVICHELGHSIFSTLYGPSVSPLTEVRALDEAFSDIVGTAAEAALGRPERIPQPVGGNLEQTLWCFAGDHDLNSPCARDLGRPDLSEPSQIYNAQGTLLTARLPRTYKGPDWCPFDNVCPPGTTGAAIGCCESHHNSTVISHWFYLIAKGTGSAPRAREDTCIFKIDALDPSNLYGSIAQAYEIVTRALRDELAIGSTGFDLPMFAAATVTAAGKISGSPDSPMVRIVKLAWFAVGVTDEWTTTAKVTPALHARAVNPWVEFTWPPDNQAEWEIQVSVGATPNWNPPTHEALVTKHKLVGTEVLMSHGLALPENRPGTVFWRVRPRGGVSWSCQPVYSFQDTGALRTQIEEIRPATGPDGLGTPGKFRVTFKEVEGAVSYKVDLSNSPRGCDGTSIDSKTVDQRTTIMEGIPQGFNSVDFDHVQPEQSLWINITATGPKDTQGNPTQGVCTPQLLQIGAMPPPTLLEPADGDRFDYRSPHLTASAAPEPLRFSWSAGGQPGAYEMRFYPRDGLNQACSSTPSHVHLVVDPDCASGTASLCTTTIEAEAIPLPYPGGYCWDVVSVGQAHLGTTPLRHGSASTPRTFVFFMDAPFSMVPGADASLATRGDPAPILEGPNPRWESQPVCLDRTDGDPTTAPGSKTPLAIIGDSYGKLVPLHWEDYPNAFAYDLQVAKWPWLSGWANVGGNCPSSGCTLEEATTFTGRIFATSFELTPDQGGKGRYCWQVVPVIADPNDANQPASVQPAFRGNAFCYTTGPAEPTLKLDSSGKDANGYWDFKFTGFFELPYLPNSQGLLTVPNSPNFRWLDPPCTVEGPTFLDIKGCRRRFEFDLEGTGGGPFRVDTFNSADLTPILSDETRVHCAANYTVELECGTEGKMCCKNQRCNSGLGCAIPDPRDPSNRVCQRCGKLGEACCPGRTCSNARLVCGGLDTCIGCGPANGPCCDGRSGPRCDPGSTCRDPPATCVPDAVATYSLTKEDGSAIEPCRFYADPDEAPDWKLTNTGNATGTFVITWDQIDCLIGFPLEGEEWRRRTLAPGESSTLTDLSGFNTSLFRIYVNGEKIWDQACGCL